MHNINALKRQITANGISKSARVFCMFRGFIIKRTDEPFLLSALTRVDYNQAVPFSQAGSPN